MRNVVRASLALAFFGVVAAVAEPPSGRKVDLKASDGTKLAMTYYASERPGSSSPDVYPQSCETGIVRASTNSAGLRPSANAP